MLSRLITLFFIYVFSALPLLSYAEDEFAADNSAKPSDILFSMKKAEDSQQPMPGTMFTASAQLGFLYLTGDTRTADIKSGLDLRFERGLWRSFFIINLLVKKADTEVESSTDPDETVDSFDTTDQEWSFSSQTNYTLSPIKKNYIYGSIYYEEDRFSSFDSQASISTGWGRRWFEDRNASFDADIGPGFKRDVPNVTAEDIAAGESDKTQDTLILQAQALYIRKMNEFIEFKQSLTIKHAIERGQNSIYKAESSVTSRLIDSLQIKLSFLLDYNSKVDEDNANLNTQTSAVLIYSF